MTDTATSIEGGDDTPDVLDIRDAKVAAGAISGLSAREIGMAENVSERQVFRILAKPAVRQAIDGAAKEMIRTAALVVRSGAGEAARTLVSFAKGELAAPASVRLAAAAKIVEIAESYRVLDEIDARLADLEARGVGRAWRAS